MEISSAILAGHMSYSKWASHTLLDFALTLSDDDSSKHIPNSHGGILKTFQHTFYADRAWFRRLTGGSGSFEDPAPGPSLAYLDSTWWILLDDWCATLKSRDPQERIEY